MKQPPVMRLRRHAERLTPAERAVLDALAARFNGDLIGHLRAARQMLRYFPGSAEAPLLAARAAVWTGRPQEALQAPARTDPQRGLNLISPFSWLWRCSALHQLGQHEAEVDAARRAQRQFPGSETVASIGVSAFAALGRVEELNAVPGEGRAAPPPSRYVAHWVRFVPEWLTLVAVRELRWHGHSEAAERLLANALSRLPARAPAAAPSRARFVWGELLYEAGRWQEAGSLFTRLLDDEHFDVAAQGSLGAIAARVGDRALAQRISGQLAARDGHTCSEPAPSGGHISRRCSVSARKQSACCAQPVGKVPCTWDTVTGICSSCATIPASNS